MGQFFILLCAGLFWAAFVLWALTVRPITAKSKHSMTSHPLIPSGLNEIMTWVKIPIRVFLRSVGRF